jgi:hypothetical protein
VQPAFGAPAASTPAFGGFGAASTPAFGAASTPAFGGFGAAATSSPAFGAPAAAASTPAFGASPSPFGAPAAPAAAGFGSSPAGFGAPPAAQQVGAASMCGVDWVDRVHIGDDCHRGLLILSCMMLSHCLVILQGPGVSTLFVTCCLFMQPNAGSRVAPYSKFQDKDSSSSSGTGAPTTVQYNSITAMPQYQAKSVEELRWEDYQSGVGGEGISQGWSHCMGGRSHLVCLL